MTVSIKRETKDVPGNAPCGAVNVKSSKARRTAAPEGFWVVALTCAQVNQ